MTRSSRQRRIEDALRRYVEKGVAQARRPKPRAAVSSLADGLRNVNRTATRALDEAGVPDQFQGEVGDWDLDEREGRFDDF